MIVMTDMTDMDDVAIRAELTCFDMAYITDTADMTYMDILASMTDMADITYTLAMTEIADMATVDV